jgi:hypothetical protein
VQTSPSQENVGTPSGFDGLRHLASSTTSGSASTMRARTFSAVSLRQSLTRETLLARPRCGRLALPSGVVRIFSTSFASVYPHYVTKVERKGRTQAELDQVIEWLTGFDEAVLQRHLADGTTFEDFFADAHLNPNASLITGVVCGIRVEDVDDPLMQQIRYLDKLVDELARGKPMERILRA